MMRWFLTPFVPVLVFYLSAVPTLFITIVFSIWIDPAYGFIAAFSVVLSAYSIAPSAKQCIGIIAFFVGAIAAWFIVGESYYPENYANPYQPTYLPLMVTYGGGLLGLVVCFFLDRKHHKSLKASVCSDA